MVVKTLDLELDPDAQLEKNSVFGSVPGIRMRIKSMRIHISGLHNLFLFRDGFEKNRFSDVQVGVTPGPPHPPGLSALRADGRSDGGQPSAQGCRHEYSHSGIEK